MDAREREDDLFLELAIAVERGDIPAARSALDLMYRAGSARQSQIVGKARRKARPLPAIDAPSPLVLPIPGHGPRECGLPPIQSSRRRKVRA